MDKDNRRQKSYRRLIRMILPVLCVLLILIAGLYYAFTKDLQNGVNRTYLETENPDEMGEIVLSRDTAVEQQFLAYHDFDGVSLLLDHSRAAGFRTVKVSVTDVETGETVLERSLPVWSTRGGNYAFFASERDIHVEAPSVYRIRVTTGGIGGGSVVLKTGSLPEEVSQGLYAGASDEKTEDLAQISGAGAGAAFGVVSGYQRRPLHCVLIGAAVIILCCWLAALRLFVARKSKRPDANAVTAERTASSGESGGASARFFWISCYVWLAILTLSALPLCRVQNFHLAAIGGSADGSVTVVDDTPLDLSFQVPEGGAAGIYLNSFQSNGLNLQGVSLNFTLRDLLTGLEVQNLTVDPSEILTSDEGGMVFIPFADRYNPGTILILHIESRGLHKAGVSFGISYSPECGGRLYMSGEEQNYVLQSYLTAESDEYPYSRILVTAALCALVLTAVMMFSRWKKIPAAGTLSADGHKACATYGGRAIGNSGRLSESAGTGLPLQKTRKAGERKNFYIGLILAAAVSLILTDWVYATGIVPAEQTLIPVLDQIANGSSEWVAVPDSEHAVTQSFTADDDELSAVAVELSNGDYSSESLDGLDDMTITAVLSDAGGNVVSDETYAIPDLEKVSDRVNKEFQYSTGTVRAEMTNDFRILPLAETIHDAKGQTFNLTVYTESDNTSALNASTESGLQGSGSDSADAEIIDSEEQSTASRPEESGRLLIARNMVTEGSEANLISLYEAYRKLPGMFAAVSAAALILLLILYLMTSDPKADPGKLYLFWALAIGVFFSLMIPVYLVPDEADHIGSIYHISNDIMGVQNLAAQDYIREHLSDIEFLQQKGSYGLVARYRDGVGNLFRSAAEYAPGGAGDAAASGMAAGVTHYRDIMSNTTVWTYLPAALGFSLARLLQRNMFTAVMFARWANLLTAALMIYAGMRKCPFGKRAFLSVALFPMLIQMTASCSYDALIIGYSFLYIGYSMHILLERDISSADILIVICSGALLVLNKNGVYLPVIGLLLLLPLARGNRKYRKFVLIAVLAAAAVFAAGILPNLVQMLGNMQAAGSQNYSVAYFLQNPGRLIHVIENTALMSGDTLLQGVVGDLASGRVYVPVYLTAAVYLIVWRSTKERDQDRLVPDGSFPVLRKRTRIGIIMMVVLGIVFLDLAFLLTMTAEGGLRIPGLQGRYFLPYALMAALAAAGGAKTRTGGNANRLIFLMGCVHCFILLTVFKSLFAYF